MSVWVILCLDVVVSALLVAVVVSWFNARRARRERRLSALTRLQECGPRDVCWSAVPSWDVPPGLGVDDEYLGFGVEHIGEVRL